MNKEVRKVEQETMLKEILNTLSAHSKQLNEKMDAGFAKIDRRFEQVDKRFERVEKRLDKVENRLDTVENKIDKLSTKFDAHRIELQETQETAEFSARKAIQHEKKLREINTQ
jgi:DNA anti-recombination protein RmuC